MKKWMVGTLIILLLISAGIRGWNRMPISLDQIDETYQGRFYHGALSGKTLNYNGVQVFKTWIETRTRPDPNPFNIIWQHFWYNCFTTGYDQVVWVEPDKVSSKRNYAVYCSGRTIFLRVEYDGWNQVLRANFSPIELETELGKFLSPLQAEAQ